MVSTTGTPVSLKAELWFPIPGQQGHGARIIQQAVLTAFDMMNDGNDRIVDIDLEKFFDTVNHDKLMTIIGKTI